MEITKKGNCINFGNCPKADRKEIIELNFTEDFVCPECQQDLVEIAKKTNPLKKMLIPGSIILVIVIIIGGGYTYFNFQKSKVKTVTEIVKEGLSSLDSMKEAGSSVGKQSETNDSNLNPVEKSQITPPVGVGKVIVHKTPEPTVKTQKKLNLDFGDYEGETLNGLADGQGIMHFNKRQIINPNDPEKRYAEAGEYVSGVFHNGYLVNGKLFGKDKQQKAALFIGQ